MKFLLTTLGTIAAVLMFLVVSVPRTITATFSSLDLSPEPRIRGPDLFSGLRSFLDETARAISNVFGVTRHEAVSMVATMRSGPDYLDAQTSARDPTLSGSSVASIAVGIVDDVTHGLMNLYKMVTGRVARNP